MNKLILLIIFIFHLDFFAQKNKIVFDNIPSDEDLLFSLAPDLLALEKVYEARDKGNTEQAIELLMDYFKEKYSERYYFSWKNFRERFTQYAKTFADERAAHIRRANEHSSMFPANTEWKLPFKSLQGENVTAYELRHLARQHKSINAALAFYYEEEKSDRVKYFVEQARSLNEAFKQKKYDDGGNAIYEVFHAGYRVQNWLFVHGMYLASEKYTKQDQILLIKTFLHTAAQIANRGKKFSYGNHHTKGLTALFLVSTLFPEFSISKDWQKSAIDGLVLHLQREVNDDGFQFERSVHYHMGDVDNYFYVYQLGLINKVKLPEEFTTRFRSMFDSFVKMAQPIKKLPVLQDDTDMPWGEFNEIKNTMTIGALLFQEPTFRYFASDKIGSELSWYFLPSQIEFLKKKGEKPQIGSQALEQTGYYVMRKGWREDDFHMIISAGLSKQKPDHQHGDMLGIVAYAFGNQILPNYQVRYNLDDYSYFKNTFVKNVAIVDSVPQARGWKKNEGESGFGKWYFIPTPKTLAWFSNENIDYYCGTHNGYDSLGVKYYREVFFIKDGFAIVRDKFISENQHNYFQIWQGHYDFEKENVHIRSTFQNGAGLDIVQLNKPSNRISKNSIRGKGASNFVAMQKQNYLFETLIYPFGNFETRILDSGKKNLTLNNWEIEKSGGNYTKIKDGISSNCRLCLRKGNEFIFIGAKNILLGSDKFDFMDEVNLLLIKKEKELKIKILSGFETVIIKNNNRTIFYNDKELPTNKILLNPLDEIKILL
jgi:hypothetical protein